MCEHRTATTVGIIGNIAPGLLPVLLAPGLER